MSQAATAIFIALFTLAAVTGVVIAVVRTGRHFGGRRRAARAVRPRLALLSLAAAGDEQEREESLRQLARAPHGDWRAAEPIAFDLLAKVRGEAQTALAEAFRRRGLVARAQRNLRAPGPVRRARAASALGSLGEHAAVPQLCRLLGDANPDVRIAAVQALGRLGDPEAVSPLIASLEERNPTPSQMVAHALIQIGTPAVPLLSEALDSGSALTRATALDALRLLGATDVEVKVEAVLAGDPAIDVRYRAAATLGRVGSRAAVAPLVAATAAGAPPRLRAAAARALGELGDPVAVPPLAALLDTPDHRLGAEAGEALLRLGTDGAAALERAKTGAEANAAAHARQAFAMAALARQRAERGPRTRPAARAGSSR